MKIVFCNQCKDSFSPIPLHWRECNCGQVKSIYMLSNDAIVLYGEATVIAIDNRDIEAAIEGMPMYKMRCWNLPNDHQEILRESKTYPKPNG